MTSVARQQYKVVGTSPIRHDGTDKVTGRANYGADIHHTGSLYGKVLRSPHAHARISGIDFTRALQHPGVKAIVTSVDLPPMEDKVMELGEEVVNYRFLRAKILADKKALYKGHPIAAVAAESSDIAEEALSLIDVTYEVLSPVLTAPEAMKEDASLLHDDLFTDEIGYKSDKPSNIAEHSQFMVGDVKTAFSQADVVIEREFTTVTIHQGYIEPQNATAIWEPDGRLVIWCSTQGQFGVRSQVAELLQMSVAQVKVIPSEIGGGFGGKNPIYLEPLAALLSRKTGKPVKMVMKRDEVLEATGPAPGCYMRCKVGATNSGKIVAVEAYLAYEAGAFPGTPVGAGMRCMLSPYEIDNVLIDGYDVVNNKPKTAAYRAPGAPHAAFAVETVINELAEKLSIDPLEFRLRNAATEGTRKVDGTSHPLIGYEETVQAAYDHPHYKASLGGPNRGRGVATGYWPNGGGPSSCTLSVNSDGSVSLIEGSPDIGGSRASISMQAAEVLGLPPESFNPSVGDTDSIGFTGNTGGSRVTYATGFAAYQAANDIKDQLINRAAMIWGIDKDQVIYNDGIIESKVDTGLRISFKELAEQLNETGGPVSASASVSPMEAGAAYAVHIVDVEVDPETGKIDVLRYTALQDVGKAVHPAYVEGQIQGGVAQGVGWTLNEEYFYDSDGRMKNVSLLDYRMPIAMDLPMIDVVLVEVANPGHPYGVRGVGEVPIVPPLPAIADAVYNATGVRFYDLPINPSRVVNALQCLKGDKK